jgi:hypothetical protein
MPKLHTGPKGGIYYMKFGSKVYIPKKLHSLFGKKTTSKTANPTVKSFLNAFYGGDVVGKTTKESLDYASVLFSDGPSQKRIHSTLVKYAPKFGVSLGRSGKSDKTDRMLLSEITKKIKLI